MVVLEDFENITGWTEFGGGTNTIQNSVAVVGNALEITYSTTGTGVYKQFNEESYGIYFRTTVTNVRDSFAVQLQPEENEGTIINFYAHNTGVFGYYAGSPVVTSTSFSANTWYWLGYERIDNTHLNLRVYNEAKTSLVLEILNINNATTWSVGTSWITLYCAGNVGYFDQLTDDGGEPSPAPSGQFMVTQKYW